MFSFPAALVLGIIGIIYDSKKLLAMISALLAGGIMLLWVYVIGM